MPLSPIIERELRLALRQKHALRSRLLFAGGATLLTLLSAFVTLKTPDTFGRDLFQILFRITVIAVVIETVRVTVDLLSVERRNNTLGLLVLTGMSSGEILASKFFGGVMMVLHNLIAVFPCFALAMLAGGVGTSSLLAAAFCLPGLLLFAVTLGILGSALCDDSSAAILVSVLLGAVICIAPMLLQMLLQAAAPGSTPLFEITLLSPAYGPFLVWNTFFGAGWLPAAMNSGAALLWSTILWCAAAAVLKRTWRENPVASRTDWIKRLQARVRRWTSWQRQPAKHFLELNPCVWLTVRDRRPVMTAWGVFVLAGIIWLTDLIGFSNPWLSIPRSLLLVAGLLAAVGFLAIHAAAKRIGEDRQCGGLELLLVTQITPEEIVDGTRRAIAIQFRPVGLAVILLAAISIIVGLFGRSWDMIALVNYTIAWAGLLLWAGLLFETALLDTLWISLHTGRPTYSAIKAIFVPQTTIPVMIVVFNLTAFRGLGSMLAGFPYGTIAESVVLILLLLIPLLFMAFSQKRDRRLVQLKSELRQIAQTPVPDPNDPRLAQWDTQKRFPHSRATSTPSTTSESIAISAKRG